MPSDVAAPALPVAIPAADPDRPPRTSFDLLSEPWIPVQLLSDGTQTELSLPEVLTRAHTLRRLVGDVPTQEFALLRLLLAVLHDAVDGPEDLGHWTELWAAETLPADDLLDYLGEHRDRFDLLHPTTPFLQVPDLRTAGDDISRLDRIVADVPNNERFFTMRASGVDRLDYAEAARWLVHAHAFDPSGIKSGAVGDPRVKGGKVYPQGTGWTGNLGGVHIEGGDLRRTLLLNLVAADTPGLRINPPEEGNEDRPAWRRPPCGPGAADPVELSARPTGVRDLYTWQSRRVRLHHDGRAVTGVVLGYGDPLTAHNRHDREPMTAWRRSPAQEKKLGRETVYLPRTPDPGRAAWRGVDALVTGHTPGAEQRREAAAVVRPRVLDWMARLAVRGPLPPDLLIRTRTVGLVYGTQQSVIDEVVDDAVPLPVVLLNEPSDEDDDTPALGPTAVDAVRCAEAAVTALGDLAADLAEAAGAIPDGPKDTARDLGFGEVGPHYLTWLAALRPGDDPRERYAAWQHTAHRVLRELGDDLLAGAGSAAHEGRVATTRAGTEVWLCADSAHLRFRRRLRRELPLAFPRDTTDGGEGPDPGPDPADPDAPGPGPAAAPTASTHPNPSNVEAPA